MWLNAAASVGIAAVCGATIYAAGLSDNADANRCIAYVGEEEITDTRTVLSMMQNDLADINEATHSLRTDAKADFAALAKELSL